MAVIFKNLSDMVWEASNCNVLCLGTLDVVHSGRLWMCYHYSGLKEQIGYYVEYK